MGVYANGTLLYGIVNEDLSIRLQIAWDEHEEAYYELMGKHHLDAEMRLGDGGPLVVIAHSVSASAKSWAYEQVKPEDLVVKPGWDENIKAFLQGMAQLEDVNIDPEAYKPGWYILGYMN